MSYIFVVTYGEKELRPSCWKEYAGTFLFSFFPTLPTISHFFIELLALKSIALSPRFTYVQENAWYVAGGQSISE